MRRALTLLAGGGGGSEGGGQWFLVVLGQDFEPFLVRGLLLLVRPHRGVDTAAGDQLTREVGVTGRLVERSERAVGTDVIGAGGEDHAALALVDNAGKTPHHEPLGLDVCQEGCTADTSNVMIGTRRGFVVWRFNEVLVVDVAEHLTIAHTSRREQAYKASEINTAGALPKSVVSWVACKPDALPFLRRVRRPGRLATRYDTLVESANLMLGNAKCRDIDAVARRPGYESISGVERHSPELATRFGICRPGVKVSLIHVICRDHERSLARIEKERRSVAKDNLAVLAKRLPHDRRNEGPDRVSNGATEITAQQLCRLLPRQLARCGS